MTLSLLLFVHFLSLSLLAVGGGIVLVPEIHRLLVDELHLLSDASFAESIAIAQAGPGPNVLFIAVLGHRVQGVVGALATMLGVMLPSATLTLLASRYLGSRAARLEVQAFKLAMAPIVIALMCASGFTLAVETPGHAHLVLVAASALLVWRSRAPLLALILIGGFAGALGLV